MGTLVGMALDGVVLFNAVSANSVDPFYPKSYTLNGVSYTAATEMVDGCGGHPQDNGLYHYHMAMPCIAVPSIASTI